ncbi:MAG: shikimate dehydrogenase [Chloroflexi bacterium]|nr:shikimate dehydrogenase [Chloroflexota bacterium]
MAYKLGLVGYPVHNSLSPVIHKAALQALKLEGDYILYPIPSSDLLGLRTILFRAKSGEIYGLNITRPHKVNVIQFLDFLTSSAKSVGAVNTIFVEGNKLIGENTDVKGFLRDLHHQMVAANYKQFSPNALVFGAGGSARAVVRGLVEDGWKITISARQTSQALQLKNDLPYADLGITNQGLENVDLAKVSLIVNATPLGMAPKADEDSPWPKGLPFPARAMVYDLVYHPRETKLAKDARKSGLFAVGGIGMLIEQAALSFEIWTGQVPPRDILTSAVLTAKPK